MRPVNPRHPAILNKVTSPTLKRRDYPRRKALNIAPGVASPRHSVFRGGAQNNAIAAHPHG